MTAPARNVQAVLFDLDGTLVDSAPDLAGAVNTLRTARGLPALPLEALRPMVGAGARGMIGVAFGVTPSEPAFAALRDEFLAVYERTLLERTQVFEAMLPVLEALQAGGMPWGIVTNKATRYTEPIVEGLGLRSRIGALVCGDTTAHAKPHPAPLLEAARQLGRAPADCIYVGDDHRDVAAGRAAGMPALVALWGYLGQGEPVEAWGADAVLAAPNELLHWLRMA